MSSFDPPRNPGGRFTTYSHPDAGLEFDADGSSAPVGPPTPSTAHRVQPMKGYPADRPFAVSSTGNFAYFVPRPESVLSGQPVVQIAVIHRGRWVPLPISYTAGTLALNDHGAADATAPQLNLAPADAADLVAFAQQQLAQPPDAAETQQYAAQTVVREARRTSRWARLRGLLNPPW